MTNKFKYFIGNWKMFGDSSSIKIIYRINHFVRTLKKSNNKNNIILCVPNTLIFYFTKKIKSALISIGAQDCHHHHSYGAFTGAVSALILKKSGAKYVILGHSENRFAGDSNLIIKKKVESALKNNLNIIFCVGETYKEKVKGKTFSIIKKQISDSISGKFNLKKIIISYEPVWSIGTGKIPKSEDLIKTFSFIKNFFKKRFGTKINPIVLYGGSVNERNVRLFSTISQIDGFLIGGASQSSKKFIDIIKNYYK